MQPDRHRQPTTGTTIQRPPSDHARSCRSLGSAMRGRRRTATTNACARSGRRIGGSVPPCRLTPPDRRSVFLCQPQRRQLAAKGGKTRIISPIPLLGKRPPKSAFGLRATPVQQLDTVPLTTVAGLAEAVHLPCHTSAWGAREANKEGPTEPCRTLRIRYPPDGAVDYRPRKPADWAERPRDYRRFYNASPCSAGAAAALARSKTRTVAKMPCMYRRGGSRYGAWVTAARLEGPAPEWCDTAASAKDPLFKSERATMARFTSSLPQP